MYETFEHGADVGIRGRGKTLEGAFEEGARALFSVMFDLEEVKPQREVLVRAEGSDIEMLFVQWLNNLLATAHLEGMIFCDFEVKIDGLELEGVARGEALDLKRHQGTVEVKGATLTSLRVGEEKGRFVAQCVVDV